MEVLQLKGFRREGPARSEGSFAKSGQRPREVATGRSLVTGALGWQGQKSG